MSSTEAWKVFESINPMHAAALSCSNPQEGFRYTTTCCGEENLYDERGKEGRYIHSQDGAFQEARAWVSSSLQGIDSRVEVLVVYGVGLGWYWKALLPWLERKKERRVIFIEDDLAIIHHLMESSLGSLLFLHPQTSLVALGGIDDQESLDIIVWNLFRRRWRYIVSPLYSRYRPKASKLVQDALFVRASDVHLVADEFSSFGIVHARNLLRNLTCLMRAKNGADLFQSFKGFPAIVVAAGPSLKDAIPFLQKIGDSALILSGGSSTNALLEAGIIPHFAATVDPNPLQYSRMKYLEPFHLPLFFRSRALHEGILASGGNPLFYLRGSDGYPLVTYLEERLGINGEILDGGDSVSSLLIELAFALGSTKIIMVGYDLAYAKGERYSKTLEKILHESETIEYVRERPTGSELSSIFTASNNGGSVATEAKWIVEGQWIEGFRKRVSDEVLIINTSKEGMLLDGIPYMSLQDVEATHFPQDMPSRNVMGKVLREIYSSKILSDRVSVKTIAEALQELSKALSEAESLVSDFLARVQQISPDHLGEDVECLRLLQEIESGPAMHNLLLPFWQMHAKWLSMRQRIEIIPDQSGDILHKRRLFEAEALTERVQFIREGISAYKKLLFSFASWSCLQGVFLQNPFSAAPWPDDAARIEAPSL